MKPASIFLVFFAALGTMAQDGLRNMGSFRIYNEGGLGLHADLVNDGVLDNNLGLVGFYGNSTMTVTGAFSPIFYDIELMANHTVQLDIGMEVGNNANFILGDMRTPRSSPSVSLAFGQDAFHTGAGDMGKVDGYVTVKNQQNFIFPIGDGEQLRPLILDSERSNATSSCAYFYEDPNDTHGPTTVKEAVLQSISNREFWHLEGSVPSTVQLSWNERSGISLLTDQIVAIVIVGWNTSTRQWESLGGNAVGTYTKGLPFPSHLCPMTMKHLPLDRYMFPSRSWTFPIIC